MISSASSSPILLLNAATEGAKPATATNAEATPDAALSGFQLLLSEMTQLPLQPAATAGADAGGKSTDAADGGNALPLSGALLPFAALQSAETLPDEKSQTAAESKKSDDATDEQAADAILGAMLPVSNPITLLPARGKTETTASKNSSDVIASALATAALAGNATVNSQRSQSDNKPNRNNATLAIGNTANGDSAVSATVTDIAADIALPAAAKTTESDFDTLIKHFDLSSSPTAATPAANTTLIDSVRAHQSSRAYIDAGSTNTSIQAPVGSNGWSDAVADKVMWLSANNLSSAEIHLNPPDLGPLQVRVSTQHDQTSVVFTSQHAAVRDALDQALPRLRDMMGSQGMHLLDVSVGGQNAQQQSQQQQYARNNGGNRGDQFAGLFGSDDTAETSAPAVTSISAVRFMRSGVDAYV